MRFPGQYADAETGLFENWNRFYDPVRGQYLGPDPQLDFKGMDSPFGGAFSYALNNPILRSDSTGLTIQANDNASGYQIQQLMRSGDPMIRMKMAQLSDDRSVLVTVTNDWDRSVVLQGETVAGPRPGSTNPLGEQEVGVAGHQVSRKVFAVFWMHSEAVKAAFAWGIVPSSPVGVVGHEFGHAWFMNYRADKFEIDLTSPVSSTDAEEALSWEESIRGLEKLPPRGGKQGSEAPYFAAPLCARKVLGVCTK